MLIGLTGQIGAGKSAVADIFKSFGAIIIDADLIGKQVVDQHPELLKQLVNTFGAEILKKTGSLDRSKLALRAFANRKATEKLNNLVHPYLLKDLRNQIQRTSNQSKIVIVDAALLHYWKLDPEMDIVIVVNAKRDIRFARMKARGISASDTASRQKSQLPFAEMKRRSHIIIPNNGSRNDLKIIAMNVWRILTNAIDR